MDIFRAQEGRGVSRQKRWFSHHCQGDITVTSRLITIESPLPPVRAAKRHGMRRLRELSLCCYHLSTCFGSHRINAIFWHEPAQVPSLIPELAVILVCSYLPFLLNKKLVICCIHIDKEAYSTWKRNVHKISGTDLSFKPLAVWNRVWKPGDQGSNSCFILLWMFTLFATSLERQFNSCCSLEGRIPYFMPQTISLDVTRMYSLYNGESSTHILTWNRSCQAWCSQVAASC